MTIKIQVDRDTWDGSRNCVAADDVRRAAYDCPTSAITRDAGD